MRFRFLPGILILRTGGFFIISLIFFAAGVSLRIRPGLEAFAVFFFAFSTTLLTADALFILFFVFDVFSLAVFFAPFLDCYTRNLRNNNPIDE